ncbi:MAG TPA: hypothetical protein VEQ15_11925 [Myxococcales bacterium]|jgi:hypothetical protein|nr:hypothetical protein [Myxococcales bacterium]
MVQRHGTEELEAELRRLQEAARERRSVDGFARAALEGFLWAVLTGVCGKLVWDSARLPLFFHPLALIDVLLLWDGARSYRRARAQLRVEREALSRLREVRVKLGIDPPPEARR